MAIGENGSNGELQVRIGGYGGQGIVLAGMLLGKAASLHEGREAVFTQSYGPEARGGASNVDVIISDKPIDYPLVSNPDILMVLFQEAYSKFRPAMKPEGTLIVEKDLVHPEENGTSYWALPATKMAEELGRRIVTKVVALGYLVGKTGAVGREAAEESIRTTVKPKTIELNLKAFAAGFDRAKQDVPA